MTNNEIAQFFATNSVNILGNAHLRLPQLEGYIALQTTLRLSSAPDRYHVQIPVGGGKTGLIALTPFCGARGRVLIVAPSLATRENIQRELDISSQESFYICRGVLHPPLTGPYISEIRNDANIRDLIDAHIVVANIQQFSVPGTKWYEQLDPNFFQLIIVDEGHFNIAPSWQRLFQHFQHAPVVSFTATPERTDGQFVDGRCVYKFGYAQSTLMGLISPIESTLISRTKLTFQCADDGARITREQVQNLTEDDWGRRQLALSDECNKAIVEASIYKLRELRQYSPKGQIIATACSPFHATQIKTLYYERGFSSGIIDANTSEAVRQRAQELLQDGLLDVLVEVPPSGLGFSVPSFGVAAIFRPYESLASYIRFLRHVLRLADPMHPYSPTNKAYVVSHVDLNSELIQTDDQDSKIRDQEYFAALICLNKEPASTASLFDINVEKRRQPLAEVIAQIVERHRTDGHFRATDDTIIEQVFNDLQSRGFRPLDHGLSDDFVRQRLRQVAEEGYDQPVQPQRRREGLRMLLHQRARSLTDVVLRRLGLAPNGKELAGIYADNHHMKNVQVVISHVHGQENAIMNISKKQRSEAVIEQLQRALDAGHQIADNITRLLSKKMSQRI